jgi:hypothetical protein
MPYYAHQLPANCPTWGGWFSLTHCDGRESCRQLPAEAVADCSGPGPADEAVTYWVKRLGFDGPAWLIRKHLSRYGCWDTAELADHNSNRERLLWIWANDYREDPEAAAFLWLDA